MAAPKIQRSDRSGHQFISKNRVVVAATNPPANAVPAITHQASADLTCMVAANRSRHIAVNCGLTYPAVAKVDSAEFITSLKVPGGGTQHYDQIFSRALQSVGTAWSAVEKAVFKGDAAAANIFGRWNLDTGKDETGRMVFWS